MKQKILIADDDIDICNLLSRYLQRNGYDTEIALSGSKAIEFLAKGSFHLLLCDFRLGDADGMQILERLREQNIHIPVIIITGYSDIKVAVNVIKAGAFDYVTKPLIPDEILDIIRRALQSGDDAESAPRQPATPVKKKNNAGLSANVLNGTSRAVKELYSQIDLVAPTNYAVIIHGESGSGKEVIAKIIHENSNRKNQPFVAMDCGAISKELAGSELFGHEKGSFTGALTAKTGHFEMANGGTLFLDEIANLSYDIQVSLLRVVQEKKMKRIGGTKEINLDVRIIVASNENLADAYRRGKFREDLYHRFNEFSINVPPLRDRGEDIMQFAEFFLKKANFNLNKSINGFSDEVIEAFMKYSWPGNVRELKNIVKRAALLTKGDVITSDSIPAEIFNPMPAGTGAVSGHTTPEPALNGSAAEKSSKAGALNLKDAAIEAEFETIMEALRKVRFNKSKAAKLLNIDRKTLYNKIKQYNLMDGKENE